MYVYINVHTNIAYNDNMTYKLCLTYYTICYFKMSYKSNYVKISYMIAYNNLIGVSICFLNSFSNQWENV